MKLFSKLPPRNKKIVLAIMSFFLVTIIIVGTYLFSVLYIRKIGINLKPSKDYSFQNVEYYTQDDPLWSDDKIGKSNDSMGGYGCLITCVSSSLDYNGIPTNPGELNKSLTSIEGFQDSNLLWFKINELFPEIDYKYSRVFSSNTIEDYFEKGFLPIVKVKYKGSGIFHWLLIVGAKDGEFYVLDPLNQSKEAISLSEHGKVYAYRVLVPAKENGQLK